MIRVILADDHTIVRSGLLRILADETDIKVVGEASNATDLFVLLERVPADVLLLDVNMPGRSGIDILGDLRTRFERLRVLMLSMHPEDSLAVRALKGGAFGYLTKNADPEQVVRAIRTVHAGRKYVTESLAQLLAGMTAEKTKSDLPHHDLSAREFEVMCLLGGGKSVSEVADLLSLSTPTVSTYRSRILQKMGMRSNAEIMRYVLEHHLIE
ncbi:MAG: hypothetical protein A2X67_00960 [Ignavibacteria bacterium GWA2_55_11]|nr:MAG: hypothetical protein A2X67_00960 [Ignavibacteria bacterium GWA2_55_11]OGU43976.1 MAG: hypothetical protein A2X68_11090 [Ignavibacteria bacterium GWC2_56_12]OGU67572.1 MAG: hypothetical protein A3C56_07295 [Ignavibacteria bacterium RIFCSPHIGHO2_02_FULL_56_12]OGU70396.1 MAG: hypothetical protein A3H45_01440 [Ignavibacteria bacterium RIFCSPLOWO2_02_FULL_55_14]OGU71987.1 MAG: hypothetical protein A3G43_02910 [Ignavibacteria bacterium RIFCSPLOWO2_12_FULL_56_21]HAV22560.1 DNA-binding respons